MKKAIVGVVLVAVLFLGYRQYDKSAAPAKRYRAFAEEMLKRHYDAAAAMSDGLTPAQLQSSGSQEKSGPGPEMFQQLFPSRYDIESQETAADGSVTIRAVQTVLFNPAGVESAVRPAMSATLHQVATLRKVAGEWKVTAFENKFEKMDSLTTR